MAVLILALVPVAYDDALRFTYRQTLARWLAKAVAPDTVFLGDSMTAGAHALTGWRDVNLGTNGLQTYQIAATLGRARRFAPRRIVVMAGTNDAIEGPIDRAELGALWRTLCAEPKIVVTLVPPTIDATLNARVRIVNAVIARQCASRPVVSLAPLAGPDGRLQARYTGDGVHLSPAGYAVWDEALRRQAPGTRPR